MASSSSWVKTQDISAEILRLHESLLDAIVATPEGSPTRHHLRMAEITLSEFKEDYMRRTTETMNAAVRASQRTYPRTPPTYDRRLPTLFVGNQHVRTLLVYNMHRVSKRVLGDMLLARGQSGFYIDAVYVKGSRCSARVTCDNLASSTKMQCDAILNKLYFESERGGETRRRYVKVSPFTDYSVTTGVEPVAKSSSEPTPVCLTALRLDPIVACILKHLDNDSKLAFITAFEGWRVVKYKIGHLHLAVHDNPTVRLAWMGGREEDNPDERTLIPWLNHQAACTLSSLRLVSCPQLRIEFLIEFLKENFKISELSLVDCTNIDATLQMWSLPERVFREPNSLRAFYMEYNTTTTEPLEFIHRPDLHIHPFLMELSLKGSRFIEQSLQDFLNHAPELRVVDYTGLDIPQQRLNFSGLQHLTTVKLPYHQGIEDTLESLCTLQVRDVTITNTLGKNNKRNRAFSPRFIMDVISRVPSFNFVALGCKIHMRDTMRRQLITLGAYVTQKNPVTSGSSYYERFEVWIYN